MCVAFKLTPPAAIYLVASNLFHYILKRTDFILSKISNQLQGSSGYTVVCRFVACLKYWCSMKAEGKAEAWLLVVLAIIKWALIYWISGYNLIYPTDESIFYVFIFYVLYFIFLFLFSVPVHECIQGQTNLLIGKNGVAAQCVCALLSWEEGEPVLASYPE